MEAAAGALILFFDLDGPILDVSPRYVALHHALLEEFGERGMEAGRYWQRKRAVCSEEAILDQLGASAWSADYVRRRLDLIETRPFLAYDRPWPWAASVLTSLAEQHTLVMVTARTHRSALVDQLSRLDQHRHFQEILSAPARKEVGAQKADLIRDYLDRHGISPEGHWIIGDTEADIEAGRRVGLRTAAVLSGIRDAEHLRRAGPDYLLNDIRELPLAIERDRPMPDAASRGG